MATPHVLDTIDALEAGTALPALPTRYQHALAMMLSIYDASVTIGPAEETAFLDYLAAWSKQRLQQIQQMRRARNN